MGWINDLFCLEFAPKQAVTAERDQAREVALGLLQDYIKSKGGIGEVIKRCERKGFEGRVRSWAADGPSLPINSVEVMQLIGWRDLRKLSERANMPVDRLRDLLAEFLPMAVKRALLK
jgi:uncharacterized protein YidB (DUF937 family)